MAKKIKLNCDPGLVFSIGEDTIRARDLTLKQAEAIAGQYPGGQYVEVIEAETVKPVEKPATK